MPRIICAKCEVEFTPKLNEVGLVETFRDDERPAKIYDADLWECPVCHFEVVSGLGLHPIAEHYKDDMQKVIGQYEKTIRCRELRKVSGYRG